MEEKGLFGWDWVALLSSSCCAVPALLSPYCFSRFLISVARGHSFDLGGEKDRDDRQGTMKEGGCTTYFAYFFGQLLGLSEMQGRAGISFLPGLVRDWFGLLLLLRKCDAGDFFFFFPSDRHIDFQERKSQFHAHLLSCNVVVVVVVVQCSVCVVRWYSMSGYSLKGPKSWLVIVLLLSSWFSKLQA